MQKKKRVSRIRHSTLGLMDLQQCGGKLGVTEAWVHPAASWHASHRRAGDSFMVPPRTCVTGALEHVRVRMSPIRT